MSYTKVYQIISNNIIKNTINIDNSIDEILIKYNDKCPNENDLINIINYKNNLNDILITTKSNINLINNIINPINTTIQVVNTSINIIKNLPIPTSVPPGIGIPVNIPINFSDLLRVLQEEIKGDKSVLLQIKKSFDILNSTIDDTQNKLNLLNSKLDNCIINSSINDEIKKSLLINNLDEDIKSNDNYYYKGYKIEIKYDPNNKKQYPRRKAVGIKDNEIIEGDYSFSSKESILIDELKFKIDNLKN